MKVVINNTEYEYLDHIVDNESIRNSFMELINSAFGVDFKKWQEEGYWSEKYEPHVLVKDNQVVATVTANHMRYLYQEEKKYLQLGGVVTRKEYRKQGLGRWLIEQIIKRYEFQCDQIFLLSNDSAVDFYPRVGFKKAIEHIAEYEWIPEGNRVHSVLDTEARKLNMDIFNDRDLLLECYKKSNPFSKFSSVDCEELLMFYALGWRKDSIYYFPELNLVTSAKFRKDGLVLEDIYGSISTDNMQDKNEVLRSILYGILKLNKKENEQINIKLGFSPIEELQGMTIHPLQEKDDTMYLLEGKENLFETDKLRFPILSHN